MTTFDHNDLFKAYCDGWSEGMGDRTWYTDNKHFESVVRVEFEDWYRNLMAERDALIRQPPAGDSTSGASA